MVAGHMALLELPSELHVFPTPAARDAALGAEAGLCVAITAHLTFEQLFLQLGPPPNKRWAPPLLCRLLVRALLAESAGELARLAADAHSVRAATEALAELRGAGVTAEHFDGLGVSEELRAL